MDVPDLHQKWPAVRIYGPAISPEAALEIIRRTDRAFETGGRYLCNDRRFEAQFEEILSFSKPDPHKPFDKDEYQLEMNFRRHFDFVDLQYLASHWIATSYINGPHGFVHPNGVISLAMNFGKWPSISTIEHDLATFTSAFPEVAFKVFLWDVEDGDEAIHGKEDPTHAWSVGGCAFERIDPKTVEWRNLPKTPSVAEGVLSIVGGFRRETTWTVPEIVAMWGEKIEAAKKRAIETFPEFKAELEAQ